MSPGEWTLSECTNPRCRMLWLDPMPIAEDIGQAYAEYYTHASSAPASALTLVETAKRAYLAIRWGYAFEGSAAEKLLGLAAYLYPWRRVGLDFSVMWLQSRRAGRVLGVGGGSGGLGARKAGLGWEGAGPAFYSP